jgi:polyhydroxybutyrate depolymerase
MSESNISAEVGTFVARGRSSSRKPRRAFRLVVAAVGMAASLVAIAAPAADADQTGAQADPVASPGCTGAAQPSGESTLQFSANGISGNYIQDIPAAAGARPMPVVLDLHGYQEAAALEHLDTAVSGFGDAGRFITITPQIGEIPLPNWDLGENSPDYNYLSGLITHLESALCVDQRRVYVTGLSLGGTAAIAVACKLSNRVAAVAAVAGLEDFPWCHPKRPVPVVAFHGTADPLLNYQGGLGPIIRFLPVVQQLPSIPASAADLARHNGCGAEPTDQRITADVIRRTFPCPHDGDVALYTVVNGGHTWPGTPSQIYPAALVGPTTMSISATGIMWDFFLAHPLPTEIG